MVKRLGVAVVGYGFMGSTHMAAWSMLPEAKIMAVVGRNVAKAKKYADVYGADVHGDYREVLKRDDVDVLDVCTPTNTHRQIAVEASRASKHVLVEKPIALTLGDADEMIKSAREAGVKLMVAHCLRFFSEYARVKELVKQGVIGEPIIARALRAGPLPAWGAENWFADQERSGGVAVDLAIHDVDFLRWCFEDEVERVYAHIDRLVRMDIKAQDHALIVIKFRKGGIAHVEASWAVPREAPFTTYLEIVGSKGILNVDNQSTLPLTIIAGGKVEHLSPITFPLAAEMRFPIDAYYLEIKHFARCILEDKEPMTNGEEARRSLEVVLAAVKSSKIGMPVNLPLQE